MAVDIMNQQVQNEQYTVTLIVINNSYSCEVLQGLDPRVRVILLDRHKSLVNTLVKILELNVLLYRLRIDVLHSHDCNVSRIVVPYPRLSRVLTVHDVGLNLKYAGCYDRIVAISEAVRKDIRNVSKEVELVLNGIDFHGITKKNKESKRASPRKLRIAHVGRIVFQKKAQDWSLRAFKRWSEHFDSLELVFFGEGENLDELKELVDAYELGDSVSIQEGMSRREIYKSLHKFDILVLPSHFEGFGLALIEGMAAGLVVIASDCDGPGEIICHGENGFLFERQSFRSFCEVGLAIIQQFDNPQLLEIARKGQNDVLEKYDIRRTAQQYLEIYKDVRS